MNSLTPKVKVYDKRGRYMSECSSKRAAKLVGRKRAVWREDGNVILMSDSNDLRRVKEAVLLRDGRICYLCDEDLTGQVLTYDHITPRRIGGEDSEENFAVCCEPCNREKADRTPQEYILYLYTKACLIGFGYRIGKQ